MTVNSPLEQGGSGIGEATAHVIAQAGASVVVTGRRLEPLQRVADAIGGHAVACDVSDQAQVREMFAAARKIIGRVDVLIGTTETMARELGPQGVRVNASMPGAVSGEDMCRILARRAEAAGRPAAEIERETYTDVAALKCWVSPEEVGCAALYYACDLSSAITGNKMKLNAGGFDGLELKNGGFGPWSETGNYLFRGLCPPVGDRELTT